MDASERRAGKSETQGGVRVMKVIISMLVLCFVYSNLAIACNKTSAKEVEAMLSEMAKKQVSNGKVLFRWGNDWNQMTQSQRSQMIYTAADADACLYGAREIKFYSPKGVLVGEASPQTGVKVK
jgi:hypothetical protein